MITYPFEAASRLAVVHTDDYADWVFNPTHPTQGRRFVNAHRRLGEQAPDAGVELVGIESDLLPDLGLLEAVHDREYVESVVLDGRCGEWAGPRPDLGRLALRMAGGTLLAAQALLDGTAHTAVHFAGAKHHAMRDRSSGFCVFNDLAITARHLLDHQFTYWHHVWQREVTIKRIAILDIDAHPGDGVETLLKDDQRVLTFSIHDRSIFPGTGIDDDLDRHVFNVPLEPGAGDYELFDQVAMFVGVADMFCPDLIVIAMGADGHAEDPLSTLQYSTEMLVESVRFVRRSFKETPILLGGAGGYLPDSVTPDAWARMALAAAQPVAKGDEAFCILDGFPYDPHPVD